jgi:hypothetical protein
MSTRSELERLKAIVHEQGERIVSLEAEVEFLKPLANATISQIKADMAWAQFKSTDDEIFGDTWATLQDWADELRAQAEIHLEGSSWDGALA